MLAYQAARRKQGQPAAAPRLHVATLRSGRSIHTSPLHSPSYSSCPPHSTGSSPNPPLPALQFASPKKPSFNFEPNKHDCIYFPKDDKAHRGLDVQSYHFIYLVLLGKHKLALPKAVSTPALYHSDASVSYEELETLKLLTIKAEHFRNDGTPEKL